MGSKQGTLSWDDFKISHKDAAKAIQDHLKDCELGEDEEIHTFTFEAKNGVIKVKGPRDEQEGVPPLWYLDGYCTGDPTDSESQKINEAGFQYDWKDYLSYPTLSPPPEDEVEIFHIPKMDKTFN